MQADLCPPFRQGHGDPGLACPWMGTGLGGRGQKTGPEPHNFLKRDDRKLELRNLRTVTPWLKSPNKGFHGTRGDPSITAPARGLSPPRSLQAPDGQ